MATILIETKLDVIEKQRKLVEMDTPSNLIIADVGLDSEGPGGGCRGSTYVYLRYSVVAYNHK